MAENLGPEGQSARLQDLVAAVVRGVSSAQNMAEAESIRFLTQVGLEGGEDQARRLQARNLEFNITYPVPDPNRPGEFEPTTTVVSVPILSLMRIPSVNIHSAELDFHVDVAQLSAEQRPREERRGEDAQPQEGQRIDILGNFGRGPAPGQRRPGVSLKLELRSRETEEGISRIKQLLDETITAVPEPREEER